MTDTSIIITKDGDGNEHHHHIMFFSGAHAAHERTIASYAEMFAARKKEDKILSTSTYFAEITSCKEKSDAAAADGINTNSSSNNSSSTDTHIPSFSASSRPQIKTRTNRTTRGRAAHEHYALHVSSLKDVKSTVEHFTSSVRARGNYTLGSNTLLANMSSNKLFRSVQHPHRVKATIDVEEMVYETPVNPSASYKTVENIFTEAQQAKTNAQGKSDKKKAKMRYKTALFKIRSKNSPNNNVGENREKEKQPYVAMRPPLPASNNISRRSYKTSSRRVVVQKKEKRLHDNINMSDLTRRRVMCGQTMKSVEKHLKTNNAAQETANKSVIAKDMQLEKQVWKMSRGRGRGSNQRRRPSFATKTNGGDAAAAAAAAAGNPEGNSPRRRRRSPRGGSFLMLADPAMLRETAQQRSSGIISQNRGLPQNKQHWHTVKAGPNARAAALQTERLQRIAEAQEQKTGFLGVAMGGRTKKQELEQKARWKELIGGLRVKRTRIASNTEYRDHVLQNIDRSGKHLKTWQDGFRSLHKTHKSRLRNALTVRELHREEMNTNDHIGYILTKIEKSCQSRKPNGSETLKNNSSNSNNKENKSRRLSSAAELQMAMATEVHEEENPWKSDHDCVPEVITKGTLTSLWTDARIERRTKEEVQALGDDMVKFWHRFCLQRAHLRGTPAPGELMLVLRLKTLLEDGDKITEQVVHDMMMMAEKSGTAKHPRLILLLKVLRKQAELNAGYTT